MLLTLQKYFDTIYIKNIFQKIKVNTAGIVVIPEDNIGYGGILKKIIYAVFLYRLVAGIFITGENPAFKIYMYIYSNTYMFKHIVLNNPHKYILSIQKVKKQFSIY